MRQSLLLAPLCLGLTAGLRAPVAPCPAPPGPAAAAAPARCSCGGPATAADARAYADVVFRGRAVAVRDTTLEARGTPDRPEYRRVRLTTIRVGPVWKGELADTLAVVVGGDGMNCGFPFQAGREYLVFARREAGGLLSAFLCSRTARVEAAKADLAALGPPQAARP